MKLWKNSDPHGIEAARREHWREYDRSGGLTAQPARRGAKPSWHWHDIPILQYLVLIMGCAAAALLLYGVLHNTRAGGAAIVLGAEVGIAAYLIDMMDKAAWS